jgi:exopolysaccharide biosynthesis polyprenyl glycosylphosphotransferase
VSLAAIPAKPSYDAPACAARIIPGQQAGVSGRKRPQSVQHDGRPRAQRELAEAPEFGWSLAESILPSPLTSDDQRLLPLAVLADYGIVLASWMGVATLAAIASATPFAFGFNNPGAVLVLRSAGGGLLFAVIATLLGHSEGLYQFHSSNGGSQTCVLAKSVGWSAVLMAVWALLWGLETWTFPFLAACSVISFANLTAWRKLRARTRAGKSEAPRHLRNVLIVGAGAVGREVARHLQRHPELGRAVRGFLDDEGIQFQDVLGPPQKLAEIARAEFADEVIFAAPHRRELAREIVHEARRHHLDVRIVTDLYGCEPDHPSVQRLGPIALLTLHKERLPAGGLFLKRAMDLIGSLLALTLSAPLILVIACLITLDSPGPVFYSAARVGRKGRCFRCHKFRTMTANAAALKDGLRSRNQREGPCFKITDDPRITRLGGWLRRYSLDELPQLWNVFRGEMSLVGPRPHPVDDCERYELPHLRRLDVTPGITGLWQITARRNPSFHTNMKLDLEYIEEWTLALDLKILWKTVGVVLRGTGA